MSFGNLFITFKVQFPKKGQLKQKDIKLLRKVLKGEQKKDIDYTQKFEILDEFDPADFNPKEGGKCIETTYSFSNK